MTGLWAKSNNDAEVIRHLEPKGLFLTVMKSYLAFSPFSSIQGENT